MNDIVVYCDGWVHDGGGCSVAVVVGEKTVFIKKYEIDGIKNKRLKLFIAKNKITVPVVEYFSLYSALKVICFQRVLKTASKVYLYMDAQLIVNQVNEEWEVNNYVLKRWFNLCTKLKRDNVQLLWISRVKLVEVLGH